MERRKDKHVRYRLLSIPVSLLFVVIAVVFDIPNPMMVLIVPVVFFAYSDGYIGGALSGLVSILYSLYFFSNPGALFTYNELNVQKVLTIVLAVATVVILVGRLKARDMEAMRAKEAHMAEMARINSDLDAAVVAAQEASRAKSEFLSRMSHEIRTPMNAILGMTEIAQGSTDIKRVHECLVHVNDASAHLLGVINDILDISKIEAGKFTLSDSDFVLERMLQRVSNVNNFRFEQKNQHFTIHIAPEVPEAIITDQQRLAQVVTNLLSNAAKFTPDEGNVRLSITKEGEADGHVTLLFSVRDNGIGITEEQKDRLFQSFEQADGSISRRFGGTGLGLAISRAIVEMMGGRIWVESRPGEGSVFFFTIQVRPGVSTRANILSPNIDWNTIRILAVDDSPEVLCYFESITASLGIKADIALSGREALAKMEDAPYDVVFVDWMMPEMDGVALAAAIKERYDDKTCIVLMSAWDWAQVEAQAKAVGVSLFITKPLLPSPIIDCINKCFGEKAPALEAAVDDSDNDAGIFAGRRLLLVEDIEINREILKVLLEKTNIDIVEAENGEIAYELFLENPERFDLIFMDIHMPLMDGYEATACIRSADAPTARSIPIIAMTANVFREDIEKCLSVGMNDHLGKPVNYDEVLLKMKRYLPERR